MEIFELIRLNNLKGIREWIKNKNITKDVVNEYGSTPLHYVMQLQNEEAGEIFVENNFYIQSVDCDDDTPLHLAVIFGLANLASLLIERGANVNIKNKWGSAPLHYAAENDFGCGIIVLIKSGAKINVFDKHGETPLYHGVWSSFDTAKTLLNEGASLLTHDNNGNHYLKSRTKKSIILLLKRYLKLQKFVSCRKKLFLSHGVFLKFLNTFKFSFLK